MLRKAGPVLVGAALVVALLSRPPPRPLQSNGAPLLPRAEFLHAIGAAVQTMVADYYWIGAIQQLGIADDRYSYGNVYYYCDLVTTLDPYFYWVYPFAATGVTFNLGHWTWVNTDESDKIILKGLKYFPHDAYLELFYSYNLMYYDHEYRKAGLLVRELSQRPGSPKYLAPLATRLLAQGGDFDTALAFAETMRDNAKDDETRAFYDKRIKDIHLERILQQVDAASKAFYEKNHRLAPNVEALVSAGLLEAVPADPLGGKIQLDAKGRGESTAEKHRLEVYGSENPAPVP